MAADPFKQYLREIERQLVSGRATEHTHRAALQALVESQRKGILATNEPTRSACGAPDFIITQAGAALGYIEAKDVGKNLDEAEKSDQLKRYLEGLPNLILTDYLEFRLYHLGAVVMEARIARPVENGKLKPLSSGSEHLAELLGTFLTTNIPGVATPNELAQRMAAAARILKEVITKAFDQEGHSDTLHGQLEAFRRVLLHDLQPPQFADMYAQTICYGLFAARCNHKESRGAFTREAAVYELPETNPFLRQMFNHIAGPLLDPRLSWVVDHLAQLLDRSDMAAVLRDFGKRTRQEDPVVHFYETFLAAYDSSMREARGVYYTPEPVVSYIVRSVDKILRREFGIKDGLASTDMITVEETVPPVKGKAQPKARKKKIHRVLILDPAAGTGTFLHGVVDQIHESVCRKGGAGLWNTYVPQHLLPRLLGFELLMAPYAVAHMKLGIQLSEMGYTFQSGERLRVYLTNTLEEAFDHGDLPLFAHIIAEEANSAGEVKTKHPVMVVLGNPPYSGHSENKGAWINDLMRGVDRSFNETTGSYFHVDGQPLGERNPKWLNDDYVKFIRFAQWRIERTGHGVLAFISNHGYLDNPTFRGMRKSLMDTFDEIYVLDLHGNTKKKEISPDGSKDENVFDIQQGVAIGIFVKHQKPRAGGCVVRHADLWGVREVWEKDKATRKLIGGKYATLNEHDAFTTSWTTITANAPAYLFVPESSILAAEYSSNWPLTAILPVNSVGLVTARDELTIRWTSDEIWEQVREFASLPPGEARERFSLGKDVQDWKVSWAQQDLLNSGPSAECIKKLIYRPFDMRFTYYTGRSRGFICRPRDDVMRHMTHENNKALLTTRLTKDKWDVFCTKDLVAHKSLSAYDITYLFPLYLYPKADSDIDDLEQLIAREEAEHYGVKRRANLSPDFVKELSGKVKLDYVGDGLGDLKKTFGPEDVLHYIYAVLHSPGYRSRYADFLKRDFPRIPLTSKRKLFVKLCGLGARLMALHLLEAEDIAAAGFPVQGSNVVEAPRYVEAEQRVYINGRQYFQGVTAATWDFHVGGYQVCHKWLKDRRGRALAYEDITTYMRMVGALRETLDCMAAIDTAIDAEGGWPVR